uniref:Trafficking protein particle complex subunit 2-like protein n=2 Tax=Hemiselmis andersenii TaxID=464988 RepID=A0A6U4M355_HEMAN|mmetsp:Transcript_4615/g.10563  ORF Transcript_4615/g.10563 Transcript_4615/m.10563 type:complete len:149 (+) Transcript_4615:34-480(+)|eukprot:CAMPEP_0114133142 /NCGR_PEP_ID=MMETSP0043_2-20121206/13468_1 /TAXON_ID=464988 /ORGANISM="Hemiselmis andersenii, Strain CCMP644" /LENGTH=148 /DNA_ID=CAMNT_0001226699 /DNA_START=28 /DNA_END=474 /DNA_ORIENTATION=-
MIACVALIARTNQPLLLRCYADEAEHIKFNYVCHCSIDAFEEREQTLRVGGGAPKGTDMFLGLIMSMVEYKVVGYITCTGVRVVVVLDDADTKDDTVIRSFCAKLHALYVDAVSNPFYVAGQEVHSKRLEEELSILVRKWNNDSFVSR